ncbi:MBL fold metallo-hydrolase [uncultured Tolumonas sp.]|uniref:MBL fold metallo-hydrolase n=1 Tax=uncultured Tolumonas sp. TaxID=263765 RepID=UPI00292E5FAB|nr:MBL fold metallo-hydrolase [uncultured Tolumonas sp.]
MTKEQTVAFELKSNIKLFYKMASVLMSVIVLLSIFVYFYIQQPQFAELSPKTILPKVHFSTYAHGTFYNQLPTPVLTRTIEKSRVTDLMNFLMNKNPNARPSAPIPTAVKTNLLQLKPDENAIIWMGHSSYFLQIDGIKVLIDPVFSENASPVPFTNLAFKGSNIYSANDIPKIDYLLISHDHWDHLDYPTIMDLKDKIGKVITPLGVGDYFRQWGFNKDIIFEGDWNDVFKDKATQIHILPARHFSGRLLTRNQTLWGSFALITAHHQIYLGGDSGYGPHFKEIGKKFGQFDLAILECGQYDPDWSLIHMSPEETAKATADLNAKSLIPSHNSKFKLANHDWNEPLIRISKASKNMSYRLLTPMIGEKIEANNDKQQFSEWWK